jgi:hypothetical protein
MRLTHPASDPRAQISASGAAKVAQEDDLNQIVESLTSNDQKPKKQVGHPKSL